MLHRVGDLFELNVKLRCQKVKYVDPVADEEVHRRNVQMECEININYEIYALLGCYAAYSVNSLPTFQKNLSVPSSRFLDFLPFEDGADTLPRMSVGNYQ